MDSRLQHIYDASSPKAKKLIDLYRKALFKYGHSFTDIEDELFNIYHYFLILRQITHANEIQSLSQEEEDLF